MAVPPAFSGTEPFSRTPEAPPCTVVHGGASGVLGNGTVFKLDTNGVETVLHSFSGGADGGSPQAALVRDSAGDLYGTTTFGGDLSCNPTLGCGTVFKLDTNLKE